MNKSVLFSLCGACVLVSGIVAVLTSRSLAQPRDVRSVSATYFHGAIPSRFRIAHLELAKEA
jgi:hypothetical protein